MKLKLLTIVTSIFYILSAKANNIESFWPNSLINLNIDANKILFAVHHPTIEDGVCGIKLVDESKLFYANYLYNDISIKYQFNPDKLDTQKNGFELYPSDIRYSSKYLFPQGSLYMTYILVKTKTGENFSDVLKRVLNRDYDKFLGIAAVDCNKSNIR